MGWLDDMADPDSEPKGWREKAEKERQDEGLDVHAPIQRESIGGNRSCLPLVLLLVVSAWAIVAFGATVARAVS